MDDLIQQIVLQMPAVAILLYLLFRVDGRLKEMQTALIELNEKLVDDVLADEIE